MSENDSKKSIAWEFLELCFSWRKFISVVTIIFTVLGIILAFVLPKEYEGVASVLPSQKSSLLSMVGMSGAGSSVSNLAKQFAPLVGGSETSIGNGFNYLAILNSCDAMERVTNEFDLKKVYSIGDSSMEKTIKELRENTDFEIDKYGEVVVKVLDESPVRAAAMANAFVSILNEVNGNLSSEDARNLRIVIEDRYLKNVIDLEAGEDSLKDFQERFGAFSLPEQARATVSAGAEVESQIILNQVKVSALEKQMSDSSPEVQLLNDQIQALRQQMNNLNTGKNMRSPGDFGVFVPFKEVPEKTMQYLDLYRNVEIQQKLMELIYPMYEQAKLEEARETPTVLVLDRAVPPERKARPLRIVIIFSSFMLGLVMSCLFVVFVDVGANQPETFGGFREKFKKVTTGIENRFSR